MVSGTAVYTTVNIEAQNIFQVNFQSISGKFSEYFGEIFEFF